MIASIGIIAGALGSSPALAGEECTCRHKDGETALGQIACIRSPGGMAMARCDRVLNNTSWTFLNQPCPTADLSLPTNIRPL
jgi:hypothetical protein